MTNAESSSSAIRRMPVSRACCAGVSDLSRTTPNIQLPMSKVTDRPGSWELVIGRLVFESPAHQHGADGEAGAHRRHQQQIAPLEPLLLDRVVERERDGSGRG